MGSVGELRTVCTHIVLTCQSVARVGRPGSTVWRRFPIENACSYTVKKGYSYLCMWMTSTWLKETEYESDVESTEQRS